jgi:hypothetical protein
MVTAAAAKKSAAPETAAPIEAKAPEIKPEHVRAEAGQHNRRVIVHMPEGSVSDDLRNPKIWRKAQCVRSSALLKYDELLIFGHDETWGAQAIVKMVTNTEAHLVILKVFGFAAAGEGLFSDGTYQVVFDGGSYGVHRVSDGVPMVRGFSSEGLAIDALRKLYPQKVA